MIELFFNNTGWVRVGGGLQTAQMQLPLPVHLTNNVSEKLSGVQRVGLFEPDNHGGSEGSVSLRETDPQRGAEHVHFVLGN